MNKINYDHQTHALNCLHAFSLNLSQAASLVTIAQQSELYECSLLTINDFFAAIRQLLDQAESHRQTLVRSIASVK